MNVEVVVEDLRKSGVSAKLLKKLCEHASRIEEGKLPTPVTKEIESTFMVSISKVLTRALDEVSVCYEGPNFSRFFKDSTSKSGTRILEIKPKKTNRDESKESMTAGDPSENEIEDWKKSLWEGLPWEK